MNKQGKHFDIAVIGAGINGAGIARDAALRGLSVVVFDKNDLCSGTSAASSRLIHGGLRYLEYGEVPLVYESLHERRNLRRIAPHLVKPLRINIPIYAGARRGPFLIRLGMLAYDLLSMRKSMPGHDMLRRDELLAEEPGICATGLRAGARYFDAQITFAERLVLENLLAAKAAGAEIRLRQTVDAINIDSKRVQSLGWTNADGSSGSCSASVVVNAAGPWLDSVLANTGENTEPLIGGTKGSHIVVSPFSGAPTDAFYVEAQADGRPIFILPWNNMYLIGTTDIRYDGSPDDVRASCEEVDYLLAETNRVFPSAHLSRTDIHYAYSGIRPLPHRKKGPESAITRKHIILRNRDIAENLISIIGGKLTTYRNLAEQTIDQVGKMLHRKLPACRTHDTPLPGGADADATRRELMSLDGLSPEGVQRILDIYGSRAARLLQISKEKPQYAAALDDAQTVLAAEVVLAVRQEFATTLEDIVYRRTMLGLAADQGRPLYAAIAALAAQELAWDEKTMRDEQQRLLAHSDRLRSC